MARFLLARLGEVFGVMLSVSFLIYLVLEHNAADVAVKVIGQYSTEAQRALWLSENGYDAPFVQRYFAWLWRFVRGEWGSSTHYREFVAVLLPQYLSRTAILAGTAFGIIVPLAFTFGIAAGVREGSIADRVISFIAVGTTSIPEFASAVFLSAIFVFWLGILPGASMMTSGFEWPQLVLPVMVIVLYDFGYVARMVRAAMAEVMAQPYIRTALMKGASPARIVFRHALRNALVAPITVIMLQIPWLISGVLVTEVFFAYKGFGTLLYQACLNSDVALIEACAMTSVFVIVTTQLISDLLYTTLNPRIRFGIRKGEA
ncbi:MAG: ABC transporter permease [Alphaproteobacteria bacterium]|nr:ABC transporter permease [Alphaproteobacteria bacterium]